MKTVEGVVFRVYTKDFRGTELYTVKLDGDDNWYRLGETRHADTVDEGYKVKLGYEEDRKGNLNVSKVKLLAKGDPIQNTKRSGGGGRPANTGGGKPAVDWDAKDLKIQYQSARKDGLEFLKLVVEQEIVKLPPKTKPAERLAAIEGLLDQYTARFFLDIADQAAVARAAEETEVQETVAKAPAKKAPKAAEESSDDDDDFGDDDAGDDDEWD